MWCKRYSWLVGWLVGWFYVVEPCRWCIVLVDFILYTRRHILKGSPEITSNCFRWWGSNSGALRNVVVYGREVVEAVKVRSIIRIDLFGNYLYKNGISESIHLSKKDIFNRNSELNQWEHGTDISWGFPFLWNCEEEGCKIPAGNVCWQDNGFWGIFWRCIYDGLSEKKNKINE